MGLFDNLDPVEGLSSTGLFADIPEPPGFVERGLKVGVSGVKQGYGGTAALIGRGFGAKGLEQYGLDVAKAASEEAAPYAMDVTKVSTLREAAGVVPYALASLVPFLGVRALGGVAGALVGKLLTGGSRAGAIGGVVGSVVPSFGMSAGSIFPEAVENNVNDPIARSLGGGAVSAALDTVLPGLALRKFLGKTAKPSPGGVKGAAKGAFEGTLAESATEGGQEVTEATAAGSEVTPDRLANAMIVGGIGGAGFGGAAGAFRGRATTPPAQPPSQTDPLGGAAATPEAPSSVSPAPPVVAPAAGSGASDLPALDIPGGGLPPVADAAPEQRDLPPLQGVPAPAPEDTTARFGLPRLFSDPRIGPYVDLEARAKLAEANAQLNENPGKLVREFLEPRLSAARDEWTRLSIEFRNADSANKQSIAKLRSAAMEKVRGMEKALRAAEAAEASRITPKTGSVATGTVLDVSPPAPPPSPLMDISPFEIQTLQRAALEAEPFDRTARENVVLSDGTNIITDPAFDAPPVENRPLEIPTPSSARSRVVYDSQRRAQEEAARIEEETRRAAEERLLKGGGVSQRQEGDAGRQAPEASRSDRVITGPEGVRSTQDASEALSQQLAQLRETEQLASDRAQYEELQAKRARGVVLSQDEVASLRFFERDERFRTEAQAQEFAARPTPNLEVVERERAPRTRLRGGSTRDKAEAFLNNVSRIVDSSVDELVASGALKERSSQSVKSAAKGAFEAALRTGDTEAAKKAIQTGLLSALKGKVNKTDAGTFAKQVLERINETPREFLSTAAVDTPVIRFTHWGRVPGGMTDPTKIGTGVTGRDQVDAKLYGVNYTSAVVEGTDFNEPLVQANPKYSGVLEADKVYDATNFRQDPRWAAAQEKVRAQYGPDFGAAMAQFQKDVVADGFDAIQFPNGQLRIFKPVAVTRADALSRGSTDPADIAAQLDAEYAQRGQRAIAELSRILGSPKDLEVRMFVQRDEEGFAGRYRTGPLKDIIELAFNAKDVPSLAAHEAFHYLETKVLGHGERAVIRRGLAKGSPLFKQLVERARAYDAANGTRTAEEIEAVPQEAHAYGFEYWKRGELKATGPLDAVFRKIRQLLERVRNYIDGLGFRSIEDVYRAIDLGAYARRDGPLTAQNVAKLYDAVDGLESRADVGASAGWTSGRVDTLLRIYGVGHQPTRGQAYAVMMSPEQFLKLTSSVRDQRVIEGQSTSLDEQQLRSEYQEIYLDVEPKKDGSFAAVSHEGRHRMVALREAGITQVPVVLNMRSYNRREMAQIPTAKIARQKGAQADATLTTLEPITYGNRAALLAMGNGASVRFSKAAVTAASRMPGRPYWVQRPADVVKLRERLESLALDGIQGRNWHAESALAILQWAGYDQRKAATMAALISNFSPRTPVGLDLKKALAMWARWQGQDIKVGAPKDHIKSAAAILRRDGEIDELGNPIPTGIKRQNFFRNLMLGIDPVHYSAEEQGATIDMWMAHAFGYANDAAGSVSKSEYLFADREVKLLAKQLGWGVEETQAAIWVAIKARGNAARSEVQKYARSKGWYVPEKATDVEIVEDLAGYVAQGKDGKKLKYVIAAEKQREFVNTWMNLALQFRPSYDQFQKANYNYATAFRDLRDGVIALPEGVELYSDKDATQDTEGRARPLQLFSKASLDQVVRRAQNGEVETTQLMASVADAIDKAKLPNPLFKDLVGVTADSVGGSMKRFYLKNFSSGMNAARNSKGYANFFGVLTAYTQRKNRLIADGVESKLSRWLTASTADMQAAGKALLDRTVGGFQVGSTEYQNIYARLSAEQRALFDQANAMLADRLQLEFEADKRTMARALGAESPAYAEWLENRTAQVERLIREGYVPERRYGDHTVTITLPVTDPSGATKNITVFHEQYESEAEAKLMEQQYRNALQSVAPDLAITQGFRYSPEHDASLSYQQFLDMARRFGIEVSQNEKERLAKAMISADSVRRNRIFRRKNVPGYSEDAMRVLSEFGVTTANKVAYSEFSEFLGEAQKGTPVNITWDAGAPVLAADTKRNLWAEDGPRSGFYRNLADQTADYVMTPPPTNEVSQKLRAGASLHFLGGSFAAGVVQLSSLPMVSVPYLSSHTSYLNAFSKVSGALPVVMRNSSVLTDLAKLEKLENRIEAIDSVPGLRAAMIQAAQDGTTLDTEIYQIMGLTRGGLIAKSRNVRRALEIWMLPFRKTEQWNRAATFIAAYKIGIENNLGGAELYKFAQDAVYNTQFRYDEANRPAIARNPIWAVMFTFKSYPIFMTETLVALAKERPQAAVMMMLSLAVFAGLEGLPFAEDIMDIIDTVSQRVFGSPFNSQRALRNVLKSASEAMTGVDLSGVLLRGMVNELTGLSFASRVGMGNLIPGTRLGTADADFKRTAEELIGPAASLVGGFGAGAGELLKGNFAEAFKEAAPLAMKNVIKGWGQWDKGYATDAGGRKLVDVGGPGAVMQGLGFAPAAVTRAWELDMIDKRVGSFYTMVKEDFSRAIVKAVKDEDYDRVSELVEAITKWNERQPNTPIALSPTAIRRRILESGLPLNERTLRNLPRTLRGGSEALGITLEAAE